MLLNSGKIKINQKENLGSRCSNFDALYLFLSNPLKKLKILCESWLKRLPLLTPDDGTPNSIQICFEKKNVHMSQEKGQTLTNEKFLKQMTPRGKIEKEILQVSEDVEARRTYCLKGLNKPSIDGELWR